MKKAVEGHYTNNHTLRTMFTGLGMFSRFKGFKEADAFYIKIATQRNAPINEKSAEQELSPEERKNYISLINLRKAIFRYEEELKRTPEDRSLHLKWITLCLYALDMPPLRDDYQRCQLVKGRERASSQNFMVVGAGEIHFHLNKYKSVETYGKQVRNLKADFPLAYAKIRKSLDLWPRKWLLAKPTDSNKPAGPISQFLTNLDGTEKHLGSTLLRKIYVISRYA